MRIVLVRICMFTKELNMETINIDFNTTTDTVTTEMLLDISQQFDENFEESPLDFFSISVEV